MIGAVNSCQFLLANRSPYAGASGSRSSVPVSSRNPSRIAIRAFAGAAQRVVAMKPPANLYEVLRVKQTASPVEIKTAYRHLAKLFHPDVASSESDGPHFIEIHNAYVTLSDPTARARYDNSIGGNGRFIYAGAVSGRWRRWETDQCW